LNAVSKTAAAMPEILPHAADLVWGTPAEKERAVDVLVVSIGTRALPALCERIGDPYPSVVAHVLARIDLLDPVMGVLVAREMTTSGRASHQEIANSYFERHAPWELPVGGPAPKETVRSMRDGGDVPRLVRGLVASHPRIRRTAAQELLAVADPGTILQLEPHLLERSAIPLDGILRALLRTRYGLVSRFVKEAVDTGEGEEQPLLDSLALAGELGSGVLLSMHAAYRCPAAAETLIRLRPWDLMKWCQQWLGRSESYRSELAIVTLGRFAVNRSGVSPELQRTALRLLATELRRPEPNLKGIALVTLSKSPEVAKVAFNATDLLWHREALVRCGALAFMAAQGRTEKVPAMEEVLRDDDGEVRAEALRALARVDPDRQVERASEMVWDEDPRVVMASLASLGDSAIPTRFCDVGCRVLRESRGIGLYMVFAWLLEHFPDHSAAILWSALDSRVETVSDDAARLLFGMPAVGPSGPDE